MAPVQSRLTFIDGLRGIALILMVLNHTSRDWMQVSMDWGRYYLVYGSLLLPAPIFLFLVGFCLPISYHKTREAQPLGASVVKFFRRGIVIVGAGYLLNILVLRELPVWAGGVLQTIGLAIILLGPAVPLLQWRWARWAMLALALLLHVAFGWSLPALTRWSAAHPALGIAIFNDFPPWPWLAPAIVGLVVGWTWLEARARGANDEKRFFTVAALAGLVCLIAYAAWEAWFPTTPRFGFPRDFTLNRHWTPRGVTTFLVGGGVACLLAGTYWLMELKRYGLAWLVVLGQTALMLYFVHQLIEMTLVSKTLGIRFHHWVGYWVANAVFLVALVYVGRAWLGITPRLRIRRRGNPSRVPLHG